MNTEERWLHIAKLESENRASKVKYENSKREHEMKMQRIVNISQAVTAAMSIFNPCALILPQDKKNDKGDL
jgi:predicted RNA methylase